MKRLKAKNKNKLFKEFLESGLLYFQRGDSYLVVAGGACRSFLNKDEDPNDFDVFIVGDNEWLKDVVIKFCDLEFDNIFKCPNGMLSSYKTPFGKLQIITPKIYNSILELLDSFDLTAGRAAFDGEFLYCDKSFIRDVKKKMLNIWNVSFPLATMNRIYKYKSYGYNIYKATEDFLRIVRTQEFPDEDLFQHYID